MAYLSTAHTGLYNHIGTMKAAADNVANHVNNQFEMSSTIYRWDYGEVGPNASSYSSERDFVCDALTWIGRNKVVTAGENIIIGHSNEYFGYGGGRCTYTTSNGTKIHGQAVYIGSYIVDSEKELMSWHEAGHNWGADHTDGHYLDDGVDTVTFGYPMIASYLIDENQNSRTQFYAEDQFKTSGCPGPSPLASGKANDPTPGLYHNDNNDFARVYCVWAENVMEDWIDNNT